MDFSCFVCFENKMHFLNWRPFYFGLFFFFCALIFDDISLCSYSQNLHSTNSLFFAFDYLIFFLFFFLCSPCCFFSYSLFAHRIRANTLMYIYLNTNEKNVLVFSNESNHKLIKIFQFERALQSIYKLDCLFFFVAEFLLSFSMPLSPFFYTHTHTHRVVALWTLCVNLFDGMKQ